MTKQELREYLIVDWNDLEFWYNNRTCGVTSEGSPVNPHFEMWYGNLWKSYNDYDAMVNDPIFDGKTLNDIAKYII